MADIKVLMLTHNYPRFEGDYAGIFIQLLARRLTNYGIKPIILAPYDSGCLEYEVIEGVTVYRFRYADSDAEHTIAYRGNMHQLVLGSASGIFKFRKFLNCWRKAAFEVINKEKIELVAGHWLVPAGIVMKTIAKKRDLPMILSSHGTDIRLMRKYFNVVYRYLKSFCLNLKSWTVVSSFLKVGISAMDRSLDDILEVVPLPHDETIFYEEPNFKREDKLIVSVTRFTDQKRVDKLIKAFALVSEQDAEVNLAIYGAGPLQDELKELINRFGLSDKVELFDPVSQIELRMIYNRATTVVLNSFEEGFGLALSEAMLCGASVIGTESGGITDIIKNNETGLLVPLDDVSTLSEAMLKLINDPTLRNKLAAKGKSFAQSHYTSEKTASRYAELLKRAINKA